MDLVKDLSIDSKASVDDLYSTGFQSTELARATALLKTMKQDKDCFKIFAFTANMVASGMRGLIAQWISHGMADLVITTGGAIDHDVIRSYADYQIASFNEDDAALHKKGINRIGNILVPNSHYELLEKKVQPVFKRLYDRGEKRTSPVRLIKALTDSLPKTGKRAQSSFLVQAGKKGIPVYSPALVDSALGLQLFFFKQDHSDFVLDETGDFSQLAANILSAKRTGAFIMGGGSSKHFTLGLNLLREGLDYGVYLSTASEFDGSLSGALPKEAKSWGKMKGGARTAFVHAEASLAFPIIAKGVLGK